MSVVTQTAKSQTIEENEEIEKVREFLITHFSRKIDQHIAYFFSILGLMWAASKFAPPKTNNIKGLYFIFFGSFILYNIGRLIYWSTFINLLYSIRPIPSTFDERAYMNNYKLSFITSIKKAIKGQNEYISINTTLSRLLRHKVADFFSHHFSFIYLVVFLFLLFIVYSYLTKIFFKKKQRENSNYQI